VFGGDSSTDRALTFYDTLKTEEDIAFELVLAGFLISANPEIIDPLVSNPDRYPVFHDIVFRGNGPGPFDKRCVDLVLDFDKLHTSRNLPSYEERQEATIKLFQVESFRAHYFRHYLITPFWIYASHSPHVLESLKRNALAKILSSTSTVPSVLMYGTAVFAILELETKVTRAESKMLLRGQGYLSMIFGTVRVSNPTNFIHA
jgi:hypothetical protein